MAILYGGLARSYQGLHDNAQALVYFKNAISIAENNMISKKELMTIYSYSVVSFLESKNYDKALEYQKKCLEMQKEGSPKGSLELVNSNSMIALIYFLKNDFPNALTNQETCIAILNDLKNVDIKILISNLIFKATIFEKMNLYGKSIATYEHICKIFPDIKSTVYYNNIGYIYAKAGQIENARRAFINYQKLFPDDGRSYRNWAMLYGIQSEKDSAMHYLRKAIDLGYNDINWIKTDNSLDILRGEISFKNLLENLEKSSR